MAVWRLFVALHAVALALYVVLEVTDCCVESIAKDSMEVLV
jgi:hypothetical protein